MRNSVVTALFSTLIRPSTLSAFSVHTRRPHRPVLVDVGQISRSIGSRRTHIRSSSRTTITMASNSEATTFTVTASTSKLPSLSGKIQRTLDPSVVLMQEMIGQYAADRKDRRRLYSPAKGLGYWHTPR